MSSELITALIEIDTLRTENKRLLDQLHDQEIKLRIQHLKFEKDRLMRRYNKSCAEINDHIKNCEAALNQGEDGS